MTKLIACAVVMAACGAPARPAAVANTTRPSNAVLEAGVAGRVVNGETDEPVYASVVVVLGRDGENAVSMICDEHGSFRFDGVPPGPHEVIAYYDDAQSTQTVVVPSAEASSMRFAMTPVRRSR